MMIVSKEGMTKSKLNSNQEYVKLSQNSYYPTYYSRTNHKLRVQNYLLLKGTLSRPKMLSLCCNGDFGY